MKRARAQLRELTASRMCFMPVPQVVQRVSRFLIGWSNYFSAGHPRQAFRALNWYTHQRMIVHMRRRSQRPMRPPKGVSYYAHLQRQGLVQL